MSIKLSIVREIKKIGYSNTSSFAWKLFKASINFLRNNGFIPKFQGVQHDPFEAYHCNNLLIMPLESMVDTALTPVTGGPVWPEGSPAWVKTQRYHWEIECEGSEVHDQGATLQPDFIDSGIWCGYVNKHFGHFIAEYSTRIAVSAAAHPDELLLFSAPSDTPVQDFPAFFWQVIEALGAKRENIFFIQKPLQVKKLLVYPQAERLFGPPPTNDYLKLLSSLHVDQEQVYEYVFFSRGAYIKGGIAGERYLEKQFTKAGVYVVRPESHSLAFQLKLCLQAKTLIITEGSALHLLQLLGKLGNVVVLQRRKTKLHMYGNKFCFDMLTMRSKSLRYLDSITYTISTFPFGIAIDDGISILDIDQTLIGLRSIGINFLEFENRKYIKECNSDIIYWIDNYCEMSKVSSLKKYLKYFDSTLKIDVKLRIERAGLVRELVKCGVIDTTFYLKSNKDVMLAGVDPVEHFFKFGINEGRKPSIYFDVSYYYNQFIGVEFNSAKDVFFHYFESGWREGKNPSSNFDTKYYLSQFESGYAEKIDPLSHFLSIGRFQNKSPTPATS